jgi:hypothetical protein
MPSHLALVIALSLAAKTSSGTPGTKNASAAPQASRSPAARLPGTSDGPEAKEVRTIPIDEKRAGKVYRVRTAIGYPATIEFPEPFAAPPTCGDCGDNGLFRLDVFNEGRYLTIKPRVYPGPQKDGSTISADEFVTSLNVRLASLTLTLQVELAERDKADARVVFTVPQRSAESAFVREEIAKARKGLEDEFAGRLDQGVIQSFLRALAQPHNCAPASIHTRHEDLVLEITETCYFGSAVYFRFSVENRGRTPTDIGEVALRKGARGAAAPLPDAHVFLPQPHLEFRGTVTGVIGAQLTEGEEPARAYELVVSERGGRNRQLVASGFGF